MDVSFTNVLEGARQYFQGLPPAAASNSAGPNYSNNQSHENQEQQSQTHEQIRDVPTPAHNYWSQPQQIHQQQQNHQQQHHQPQQQLQPQQINQQQHQTQHQQQHQPQQSQQMQHNQHMQHQTQSQQPQPQEQRPSSSNARPPSHPQMSNHFQTGAYQPEIPQQYQFQRPQSREVHHQYQNLTPSASYHHQSQLYQTYHQQHQQPHQATQHQQQNQTQHHSGHQPQLQNQQSLQQHQQQPNQHAQTQQQNQHPPTQQQNQLPQNQQQNVHPQNQQQNQHLQNQQPNQLPQNQIPQNQLPQNQQQHAQANHLQQNIQQPQQHQRSYYPVPTQSKPASTFAAINPYYKHLYTPSGGIQEPKPEQVVQTSTQQYRTHNLPPIATLSLITYHSTKNTTRDAIVSSNAKTRVVPTNYNTVPKTSASCYPTDDYRQYPRSQGYQYPYQNQVAATTSSESYPANAAPLVPPQHPKQPSSSSYYKSKSPERSVVMKVKRESPLDLSVKTVRTCADSTLDDSESKYYNRVNINYPTYDGYANSFQRNMRPNVTAPKVEFHPNFAINQQPNYKRTTKPPEDRNYPGYYPTVSAPNAAHVNSFITSSLPKKNDFDLAKTAKTDPYYPIVPQESQKKRPADVAPTIVPNKISKVDPWRQSIDQQIEQRFSSYKQQQAKQNPMKMPNGNNYPMHEQKPYPNYYHGGHNQTYVPSAGAHQYPNYGSYQPNNAYYQRTIQQPQMQGQKNNIGGADKRVLSLLRNSLEIKGAKEAQKKLEQEQMNRTLVDIQQPSTDVTAPLQPKPGFTTRHNVSPFTPTSFPDQNNSMYKFHLPKAIDSVNFGSESGKYLDETQLNQNQFSCDLDGLPAFLAARIRTKAELKQVGPTQNLQNMIDNKLKEEPPKLIKEKSAFAPRRKLFSRSEGDPNVPCRDSLRSSSETSVFDFPDTDSEGEMPVLERQSLEDMRRDRKCKPCSSDARSRSPSPLDDVFAQACDSFMEQLKSGSGKKRGRRKKIESDVLAQLESVAVKPEEVEVKKEVEEHEDIEKTDDFEKTIPENTILTSNIKKENEDPPSTQNIEEPSPSIHLEDSSVPINKIEDTPATAKFETPASLIKEFEYPSKPKESDDPQSVNKSQDSSLLKKITLVPPRPAKKPSFGDGSHFGPGWEEEVYKYKKSLRMPPSLIQVTRPPQYHRLSTSLPDLDPCPPSPHEPKKDPVDSDCESNNSINIFSNKNYDSEGSSSVTSMTNAQKDPSILDKILEKCGGRKKRKYKRKDDIQPKIVPKPEKVVELLPTPMKQDETCDFRSKTIENFKDVFLNNKDSNTMTRHQARKMKQQATIKEVFGEDRPASAPPVTCVDVKVKEEVDPEDSMTLSSLITRKEDTKQALKNKLLSRERKQQQSTLLKSLIDRKIKSEIEDEDEDSRTDCRSETPSIDGDDRSSSGRKKSKFRNMRRKLSSGFDYIRKKKKQIKKEDKDETQPKQKKRVAMPKTSSGSEQDIQKEIKGWVLNKGIGETVLHRSARLGYTDITAYCLEKLEYPPSPKDNAGYTPLHEASTRGHLPIARMLLMYGANVSESARGGIRPLHEAVENGFVEIVRLLLSYGADPTLATYSGMTPLALATEDATIKLLQNHINDTQGKATSTWYFSGPASCFDLKESGFDVLENDPTSCDSQSEEEDNVEFEVSDHILPNLYILKGEGTADRWILLQDLSNMLKIKSRDALLRQICPSTSNSNTHVNHKSVLRELKMSDFLEQAHCCQFLNSGEKINTRASKIALVKYTDKVKELLQVENVSVCVR